MDSRGNLLIPKCAVQGLATRHGQRYLQLGGIAKASSNSLLEQRTLSTWSMGGSVLAKPVTDREPNGPNQSCHCAGKQIPSVCGVQYDPTARSKNTR